MASATYAAFISGLVKPLYHQIVPDASADLLAVTTFFPPDTATAAWYCDFIMQSSNKLPPRQLITIDPPGVAIAFIGVFVENLYILGKGRVFLRFHMATPSTTKDAGNSAERKGETVTGGKDKAGTDKGGERRGMLGIFKRKGKDDKGQREEPEPYTGLFGMQAPSANDNGFWGRPPGEKASEERIRRKELKEIETTVNAWGNIAAKVVAFDEARGEIDAAFRYHVLEDPELRKNYPLEPPQIFILKGASGTGKTALAKTVMYESFNAAKAKGKTIYVKAEDISAFLDGYYGMSEKKSKAVFEKASKRPTILFLDRADSILVKTGGNSDDQNYGVLATKRIKETILEGIENLEGRQCIVILAVNDDGDLPEQVRRRAADGKFDLDDPKGPYALRREDKIEILRRFMAKQRGMAGIDPAKAFEYIEKEVNAGDESDITPDDVLLAVKAIVKSKMRPLLKEWKKGVRDLPVPQYSLDDFKNLRKLKEYRDSSMSSDLKRVVKKIMPQQRMNNVGGLNKEKTELLKEVYAAVNYEDAEKNGVTPIRGALLYGSPGTGKTLMASAVAGTVGATLYIVNGADLVKGYYGETEKLIRELFKHARRNAPSIVFFDEGDVMFSRRDIGGRHSMVTTLLSEIGGTKSMNGIVVIVTTNVPGVIDPGFLRAGRIDRKYSIEPPKTNEEKIEILDIHLKGEQDRNLLDPSVTSQNVLELFGKRAFTGAKIMRMVGDAAFLRYTEIEAAKILTKDAAQLKATGTAPEMQEHVERYARDIERLGARLNVNVTTENGLPKMTPELYAAMESVSRDPDSYKIDLKHFEGAIEMGKNWHLDEQKDIARVVRGDNPKPTVGKVYGLSVFSDMDSGGLAGEGAVSPILCQCNPYAEKGGVTVTGSEVARSMQESAEQARIFLEAQSRGALNNFKFSLEFFTAAKGADEKEPPISGPSGGLAIAVALYSAATGKRILPEVAMTGAMTIQGDATPVGGLDHRGMGKLLAAVQERGITKIGIPEYNFKKLTPKDIEYFTKNDLEVVPLKTVWDAIRIGVEGNPDKKEALGYLRGVDPLRVLMRNDEDDN